VRTKLRNLFGTLMCYPQIARLDIADLG